MATVPQYLINSNLEQSGPKLVPTPKSPQAIVLQEQAVQRVKVQIRPREGRPKQMLLGTINHANFRVTKPIRVHLEVRGETVIAAWREIDEFGTGRFTSQACDDLGHTIAELYAALEADESRLGPDLVKVWRVLKEHIVFRP